MCTEYSHIDVLINNAGVMCHPQAQTADNCELHFQTNYLGLYLCMCRRDRAKSFPSHVET